jgi:hypothetical protein
LKRKAAGEAVDRFRFREAAALAAPLGAELEAWSVEEADQLEAIRPELPVELDDRAQDAAEPLLAIAELADGEWPARARRALVALRAEQAGADDETIGVRLLADVFAAFERTSDERLSTERLLEMLIEDDEAPWCEWHGKPLTARGLARLFKPFGIRSGTVRLVDGSTPKGYKRETFIDAWSRYLAGNGSPSATSDTTASASQEHGSFNPPQNVDVADTKLDANPHGYADVADVAARTPQGAERWVETCWCGCFFDATANGAEATTCPACVALRRGLVTSTEAGEMRLLARLSLMEPTS